MKTITDINSVVVKFDRDHFVITRKSKSKYLFDRSKRNPRWDEQISSDNFETEWEGKNIRLRKMTGRGRTLRLVVPRGKLAGNIYPSNRKEMVLDICLKTRAVWGDDIFTVIINETREDWKQPKFNEWVEKVKLVDREWELVWGLFKEAESEYLKQRHEAWAKRIEDCRLRDNAKKELRKSIRKINNELLEAFCVAFKDVENGGNVDDALKIVRDSFISYFWKNPKDQN